MAKLKKGERQRLLQEKLHMTPFVTDEELANFFHVSVPTIRLDRLELGIPELRERIKQMAESHAEELEAPHMEVMGELLDVTEGVQGISMLRTTSDMTDEQGVVDPQYLYAQANSLAKAVLGSSVSVTGVGNIKYKNPVSAERIIIAKAEVVRKRGDKNFVWVFAKDQQKEVFRAKFIMETMEIGGK